MKGCLILSVVLSMACGEGVAMPKPVLWLRADRTNDVTVGEIAPVITTNAFAGLPALAFADGAHLTAKAVTTNRTVVAVVRPNQKQRYNPGFKGQSLLT